MIAVLPFENRSPEPDSEVFADGLTAEIQRNLAGFRARTTVVHVLVHIQEQTARSPRDRLPAR